MNLSGYFSAKTASWAVVLKPLGKKSSQIGRLEDRNVHVADLEEVVHHVLFGVLLVLLLRPELFLGAQVLW